MDRQRPSSHPLYGSTRAARSEALCHGSPPGPPRAPAGRFPPPRPRGHPRGCTAAQSRDTLWYCSANVYDQPLTGVFLSLRERTATISERGSRGKRLPDSSASPPRPPAPAQLPAGRGSAPSRSHNRAQPQRGRAEARGAGSGPRARPRPGAVNPYLPASRHDTQHILPSAALISRCYSYGEPRRQPLARSAIFPREPRAAPAAGRLLSRECRETPCACQVPLPPPGQFLSAPVSEGRAA